MNGRNFFSTTQDGLKRNQYGFCAIGGPIQKDKTFFFFDYQGTRLRSLPTGNTSPSATAAELAGNFSALLPKTQVVDPTTGTPFPGNIVPLSRFDPISLKILAFVPAANPATGLVTYTTANVQNDNQYIGRLDRNFGDKFKLYASYIYDGLSLPSTSVANNLLAATPTKYFLKRIWSALNDAPGRRVRI